MLSRCLSVKLRLAITYIFTAKIPKNQRKPVFIGIVGVLGSANWR